MSAIDRAHQIEREVGSDVRHIHDEAHRVMQRQDSRTNKHLSLTKLADQAMKLLDPYTPCKKGCSYCCWIAVPVTRHEAERIAEATGRKMTDLEYPPSNVDPRSVIDRLNHNADVKFYRRPCTFLGPDGDCTIYEVRPMPCRVFHVIEDSSENCDCFSGHIGLYSIDFSALDAYTSDLFMYQQLADIREWFPNEQV